MVFNRMVKYRGLDMLPTFRPSRLGRGGRFFIVGTLLPWLGNNMPPFPRFTYSPC
jgi:hypothetical protein